MSQVRRPTGFASDQVLDQVKPKFVVHQKKVGHGWLTATAGVVLRTCKVVVFGASVLEENIRYKKLMLRIPDELPVVMLEEGERRLLVAEEALDWRTVVGRTRE